MSYFNKVEAGSVTGDTGEEGGRQGDDTHPRPLELAGEMSLSQVKGRKSYTASTESHQTCSEGKHYRMLTHRSVFYNPPGYTLDMLVFEN